MDPAVLISLDVRDGVNSHSAKPFRETSARDQIDAIFNGFAHA